MRTAFADTDNAAVPTCGIAVMAKASIPGRTKTPLGQKIEAVEGIVPVRHSLVGRCAGIGMMQRRTHSSSLVPPPALGECRHRVLARRGVAVRRRPVLGVPEGELGFGDA